MAVGAMSLISSSVHGRQLKRCLPAGMDDDQLFTLILGRPPANASVVRILSVRAPIWLLDAVHLIVVGLFTLLNCAIGNWLTLLLPIV